MIDQKDLSKKMSKDIDEMEKMLNDYLQFAKTLAQEGTEKIELKKLFEEIKFIINNENLKVSSEDSIILEGRPLALKDPLKILYKMV